MSLALWTLFVVAHALQALWTLFYRRAFRRACFAIVRAATPAGPNMGQEPLTQRELVEIRCHLSYLRSRVGG